MKRLYQRPGSTGQPPGILIPDQGEDISALEFSFVRYNEAEAIIQKEITHIEECLPLKMAGKVSWLDIQGRCSTELMECLGENLNIHPLTLEDIMDSGQRPKLEEYEDYLFIELNQLIWNESIEQVETNQISIILGENYVITFQEKSSPVFEHVVRRLQEGKTRLVKMGADYLVYALIDAVVDQYFSVLESLSDKIESVEETLISDPDPKTLQAIHDLKSELVFIQKSLWPLREVVGALERGEPSLFESSTIVYLRDIYDHMIQVIDTIETFREIVSGMLDIYLSSVSNRMNEIMKVLTVITTIFIPISFIAGIYGMNFKYMPELEWRWGYLSVWVVIILLVIAMVLYFRHKKWL